MSTYFQEITFVGTMMTLLLSRLAMRAGDARERKETSELIARWDKLMSGTTSVSDVSEVTGQAKSEGG